MNYLLRGLSIVTLFFYLASGPTFAKEKHSHYCCEPQSNPATRAHTRMVRKIIRSDWIAHGTYLGEMRITSYTGGDPAQGTGLHTALGTRIRYGVVAVDRNIIPLGSLLYISGFGLVYAEDTGGAVKGAHIDLCFGLGGYGSRARALASAWGTKFKRVYLIKKGTHF